MDPRAQLIQTLDRLAAVDLAAAVACARLNDALIDAEVIQATQQRAFAAGAFASGSTPDPGALDRKIDVFMGAMGIHGGGGGGTPSYQMPYRDPNAMLYGLVYSACLIAVQARSGVPPQTPPLLVQYAADLVAGRLSAAQCIQLLIAVSPPAEAQYYQQLAAFPAFADIVVPIVRAMAAGVAPIGALALLYPNAQIVRPAPVAPVVSTTPAAVAPGPARDASLVDTLLHRAGNSNDPHAAEALLVQALTAASHTTTPDDDIAVLQQIVRMVEHLPLQEATVRRAADVTLALAQQPTRRDEVARLLAWVIRAVVAKKLLAALADPIVARSKELLGGKLEVVARIDLAGALADFQIRLGRAGDADATLRAAEGSATDPAAQIELLLVRADLLSAAENRRGAVELLGGYYDAHPGLPVSLARRLLEKLLVVWPRGTAVAPRVDQYLSYGPGSSELEKVGILTIAMSALVATKDPADRTRGLALADQINLERARTGLSPSLLGMFDLATRDLRQLIAELERA